MAGKKEIILWEFNHKTLKEFYDKIKALKNMGIIDNRKTRMMILHLMAHQKKIGRQYIKGQTRLEIEAEITAWANKYLTRRKKYGLSSRDAKNNSISNVGGFFRKFFKMVKVLIMGGS